MKPNGDIIFYYISIPAEADLAALAAENSDDPYSPMAGISDAFLKDHNLYEYHKTDLPLGLKILVNPKVKRYLQVS